MRYDAAAGGDPLQPLGPPIRWKRKLVRAQGQGPYRTSPESTMGHVYAVREDNQKRKLVEITCDYCDAKTVPGKIEGWIAHGQYISPGHPRNMEWAACPRCAARLGL